MNFSASYFVLKMQVMRANEYYKPVHIDVWILHKTIPRKLHEGCSKVTI